MAPVQDISDVMTDPQYTALDTLTEVPDPELGLSPAEITTLRETGATR